MYSGVKQTPKSCSCRQCRRGKHTPAGHYMMRSDERAYRHNAKISLQKGGEIFNAGPIGNYYD